MNELRQLRGMLVDNSVDIGEGDYTPPRENHILDNPNQPNGPPPAFLTKLWQLVNEGDDNLVSWGMDGTSFVVKDQNQFAKKVLPNYFKHQKMNSFVRQLNMYGFKKVPKMSEGTLHTVDCEPIEFANEFFIKGKMEMIQKIKRKDAKPRPNTSHVHNKQLTDLLQDLQNQQQQTHRDFERLKERNQELWRQVGSLRKKHDKQQDTVNRLISFMIHFIQQTPTLQIGAKRPATLALTNGSDEESREGAQFKYIRSSSNGSPVRSSASVANFAPESPLSSAIKVSSILDEPTIQNSSSYFIKPSSENALMSSDPDAPDIKEVFSEKVERKTDQTHYNLIPVESVRSPERIQDIQRSISRQETTLSSIMNLIGDGQESSFSYDVNDMNFDEFTAG